MTTQTETTPAKTAKPRKAPAKKSAKKAATKKASGKVKKAKKSAKAPRVGKTISVLVKGNPFKPTTKRHQKWKCVRDGATVSATVAAMREKGLSSPRTFIANCKKLGHLKIN